MKPAKILKPRRPERPLYAKLKRLASLAALRLQETNIVEVSSSMTLATILSIVPLLAVVLAVFSVVPSFEAYRQQLMLLISGGLPGDYGAQVSHYLRAFSGHARGLSLFGFAGLAVSAFFLIDKEFKTINRIFNVRHERSFAQKAVLYWALLTLGPIVIAISISVTTYIARLALGGFPVGVASVGLNLLTFVIQAAGYAAMFYAIPNCRVAWRNAFAGGLFTAFFGFVVKWGFQFYITNGTLASLYGAFVALPVFILWIYLAWILIFAGAAVTATIPMIESGRFGDIYKCGNTLATGVALIGELYRAKESGNPVVTTRDLSFAVDSWPESVGAVLEKLSDAGYVSHVADRRKRDDGWVLTADPRKKTLLGAFSALAVDPSLRIFREEASADSSWYRELAASPVLTRPIAECFRMEQEPVAAPENGKKAA